MLRVTTRIVVLAIATLLWPLPSHNQLAPSQTEWINALRDGIRRAVTRCQFTVGLGSNSREPSRWLP
jgi:hypothetical protein